MYLIYRPDGGEEQRWTFQLGKLRSMEIEAIEKVTGLKYGTEFKETLLKGGALARRALLWTFQRRTHPTLRFADVDFADDELALDMDRDEWAEIRAATEKAPGMDDETRQQLLAAIDQSIESADEAPGKASTSSSATSTASP